LVWESFSRRCRWTQGAAKLSATRDAESTRKPSFQTNTRRDGDKPIVQIAGNHEYYESVMDQELTEMRRQAEAPDIHFLDRDES